MIPQPKPAAKSNPSTLNSNPDPAPTSQNFPQVPTSNNSIGNSPDPTRPATPVVTPPDASAPAESLTNAQRKAIGLLLLRLPDTAVARQLGVDRRTIYNWKKNTPLFQSELQQRRQELYESTLDRTLNALHTSLNALTAQAADLYAPTAHRTILLATRVGQHLYTLTNPNPPPPPAPQGIPATDHGPRTTDKGPDHGQSQS